MSVEINYPEPTAVTVVDNAASVELTAAEIRSITRYYGAS